MDKDKKYIFKMSDRDRAYIRNAECYQTGSILLKYTGNEKTITIPNRVEFIADSAFEDCHSIEEVIILDGVKAIGNRAFAGCINLKKVKMKDSVTKIGKEAFSGCEKLTDISLSSNISCIYERTFYGCRILPEVKIPESVEMICEGAFLFCELLKEFSIHSKVCFVAPNSFSRSYIKNFHIDKSNERIECESNTFLIDKVDKALLMTLGDKHQTCIQIPDYIETVCRDSFSWDDEIQKVTMPKSLKKIDDQAFAFCNNKVGLICDFRNCNNYYNIEHDAFYNSNEDVIFICTENSVAYKYACEYGIKTISEYPTDDLIEKLKEIQKNYPDGQWSVVNSDITGHYTSEKYLLEQLEKYPQNLILSDAYKKLKSENKS